MKEIKTPNGFKLVGSNTNIMILPGQISTLTARFEQPGVYNFVCHEFCGRLHYMMYGRLVVEASEQSEDGIETALAND